MKDHPEIWWIIFVLTVIYDLMSSYEYTVIMKTTETAPIKFMHTQIGHGYEMIV